MIENRICCALLVMSFEAIYGYSYINSSILPYKLIRDDPSIGCTLFLERASDPTPPKSGAYAGTPQPLSGAAVSTVECFRLQRADSLTPGPMQHIIVVTISWRPCSSILIIPNLTLPDRRRLKAKHRKNGNDDHRASFLFPILKIKTTS